MGDQVIVTSAANEENPKPDVKTGWSGGTGKSADDSGTWTWKVFCFSLADGQQRWIRDVKSGEPAIQRHLKASHANCTPATDGRFIVAFFGSEGLYCFDMEGELQWSKDLGKLHSGPYNATELEWGFASSPVIHNGQVIVQCDCLNVGFVAAFDLESGEERLRIDREGEVATWSTPAVVDYGGITQIVCNGYHQMAGYDFSSGERLWTLSGGGDVPVPTPLFANGLIYLTNGHGRSPTYAIDPRSSGELTVEDRSEEAEVDESKAPMYGMRWSQPRDGSYMPTPIVVGDLLYTCNDNGRLVTREAMTGELIYRERVGRGSDTYSASGVGTDQRLYFASESGVVNVIAAGPEFERIAEIEMEEVVMATPAIVGNDLLVRTLRNLYCIREDENSTPAAP